MKHSIISGLYADQIRIISLTGPPYKVNLGPFSSREILTSVIFRKPWYCLETAFLQILTFNEDENN